jgi:hypothetical protein
MGIVSREGPVAEDLEGLLRAIVPVLHRGRDRVRDAAIGLDHTDPLLTVRYRGPEHPFERSGWGLTTT